MSSKSGHLKKGVKYSAVLSLKGKQTHGMSSHLMITIITPFPGGSF